MNSIIQYIKNEVVLFIAIILALVKILKENNYVEKS